jgi:hypothetical protein
MLKYEEEAKLTQINLPRSERRSPNNRVLLFKVQMWVVGGGELLLAPSHAPQGVNEGT